jgi:lipid-binding SYLF domain-containing protein
VAAFAVSPTAELRADSLEENSAAAIALFKDADSSLQPFFESSYGYAIFPNVGKGGMGLGGAHGKGLVYRNGEIVGRTSLTQFTVGFQFGGQVYQQVIFFENDRAYDNFTGGNFELSAQASAIAAAAGVAANAKYRYGVAIFTLGKGGLMYEASVGGQKFSFTPL